MITLIFILLIATINIYGQDDSIVKLFLGKWKMEMENIEMYEEWIQETETELTGISYSIEYGEKFVKEYKESGGDS